MILIDNNQVLLGSLFALTKGDAAQFSEDLLRHTVLNIYRTYRQKFRDAGEIVLCHEGGKCWRNSVFPQYKQNRTKAKASSDIDWKTVYGMIDGIREEIRDVFPYRHMRVQGAEADDVIATLTKHYSANEQIIIVSSDKDFQQLQIYPNVRQWSPVTKGFVVCKNPTEFLMDHILGGDSGDGIPNILSDDDCFITDGKRQTPLTSKKSAAIQEQIIVMGTRFDTAANMPDKVKRNWDRNRCMVDFRYIPVELEQSILQKYADSTPTRKGDILSYLVEHKMKNLVEVVSEF
jgi:hypothetical protein